MVGGGVFVARVSGVFEVVVDPRDSGLVEGDGATRGLVASDHPFVDDREAGEQGRGRDEEGHAAAPALVGEDGARGSEGEGHEPGSAEPLLVRGTAPRFVATRLEARLIGVAGRGVAGRRAHRSPGSGIPRMREPLPTATAPAIAART